jgi:hypothetical protein
MHLPEQVTKTNKSLGIINLPDDTKNLPESYRGEMDKPSLLNQNALLSTPHSREGLRNGSTTSF